MNHLPDLIVLSVFYTNNIQSILIEFLFYEVVGFAIIRNLAINRFKVFGYLRIGKIHGYTKDDVTTDFIGIAFDYTSDMLCLLLVYKEQAIISNCVKKDQDQK